MSVEKEQFDKVMGELRRACLPAGGADAVQAYVDSLAGDLARVETERRHDLQIQSAMAADQKAVADALGIPPGEYSGGAGEQLLAIEKLWEALARAEADNRQLQLIVNSHANMRDTAQAQLAEAVGLLERLSVYKPQGICAPTAIQGFAIEAAAFLARHAQAEQQEAPQGWAPCSPDLLKSGVCCESAPRIAGSPGSGVSHYHPAPQQEAQGAQAGGELDVAAEAIFNADKDNWFSVGPYLQLHANDKARLRSMARAALATQPAEWVDQLYTQGFDAGAAASKRLNAVRGAVHVSPRLVLPTPEQVMHVVMRFQWEDRKNGTGTTNWAANLGMTVVEYVARLNPAPPAVPPAAAHGDEVVRKDAAEAVMQRACAELPEDWYIEIHLENGSGYATLFNDGIVVDFGQDFESMGAQVEAAIDAAMRAKGDGSSSNA